MKTKRFTTTEINNAEKVIRESFEIWNDVKITRNDDSDCTYIYINEGDYMTSPVIEKAQKICSAYKSLGYDAYYGFEVKNYEPTIQIIFSKKH